MVPDDTDPDAREQPTVSEVPSTRTPRTTLAGGHYRLGDTIGSGGMGEVLAAHDTLMGREVAIKRLLDDHPSTEVEARFTREAQVQGRLDHPSIPPVYELGRDSQQRPYIVMKRLSGTTLSEILSQVEAGTAPYERERLLRAFIDVCLAIEFAHTRGVIHRDLKPANIMLGEFGEVYVLDWGVAKVLGDTSQDRLPTPVPTRGSPTTGESTRAGTVIGTPVYMAPEQRLASQDLDHRADVYALGRLLCEILAVKRLRTAVKHDDERRPSFHAPEREIPPELDKLCVHATEPDRDERVSSARELADQVQRYLDGDRDLALRRTLAEGHLHSAHALYEHEATRADALREAGRALALDPTLAPAADLIGRLMLETPRTLPPEVVQTLADEDAKSSRASARMGMTAYFAYLMFIPAMLLVGMRSNTYAIAIVVAVAVLWIGAWAGLRYPNARWRIPLLLLANAFLVGIFTRCFTPFTVAPGIAALTALVLFRSPAFRGPWMVPTVIALFLGVELPWIAETAGWMSPTHAELAGNLLLTSPAIELPKLGAGIGFACYTALVITVAALISRFHTRVQRVAEQQLHLQAWRLRQLVPPQPST